MQRPRQLDTQVSQVLQVPKRGIFGVSIGGPGLDVFFGGCQIH